MTITKNDYNPDRPNETKIKYFKEAKVMKNSIKKTSLELSDLETLVGKDVSVYWCKSGISRNTKNQDINHFWDQVFDELQERSVRPDVDFKTPTQVCVMGKLEQFPDNKNHFRVLSNPLNYSYFDLDDIFVVIDRITYTPCICLKWQ